jgi:hypothetical protein
VGGEGVRRLEIRTGHQVTGDGERRVRARQRRWPRSG